ncbi:acetate--CoA ligase [Aquicella lusitana]|uniref:Acetyl-coenzyme A synthetase n=1 Tax=Aquicella lusitana TaxID=254246 RepID=A0A370G570_9COXI|nr:acetate--CoA ligase [Aquicella lusitana]RDI38942.1 acetyl-coenzyme A synthetase [Aquicella lusitana]VVC74309.1 Acetyl-coenzyme A synthetase [Aquicella lusitana]
MTDIYPLLPRVANTAYVTTAKYREWYQRSLDDPEGFWGEQAKQYISWFEPWDKVLSGGFDRLDVRWFQGGKLNAAYNCLDRHLQKRAQQPAIIWEGDNPNESAILTYKELYDRVGRLANVLKRYGIKKGDRVCIYLPMIPEAVIAMLACTRIGAIHSVVFAGFSADSLKNRILDAGCTLVITANEGIRGNKAIPLKENVDKALRDCPDVSTVIVVKRTETLVPWEHKRDMWYHNLIAEAQVECSAEIMDAEDPLFILYTSGSTGKPKGILHGTGGYLVYAAMTHKLVFDYHNREIFWCTADVGWITGHTYSVYGPLVNGATIVLFEGVPHYPTAARYWEVIDKHKVNIFYTAPTAIRALRREGDEWVKRTSRKSLRILGTVGEPINPEAWEWYYHIVGEDRCPVVDTWWQTETGGIMITPLPGATPLKPGAASWPFFGVEAKIVNDEGAPVPEGEMGNLVITQPWPGMMQTVYNDHERFVKTYFETFPGQYLTGDQASRDAEGYFWIAGRSDDVIKVSGHRIGTEEVESALVSHAMVSEAAVVSRPDPVKGQNIYAFVTLKTDAKPSDSLKSELVQVVRDVIGPIAAPGYIQWAEELPKTRSGKIMRRLLRKIANNEVKDMGDLSTLANPVVVEDLIKKRNKSEVE